MLTLLDLQTQEDANRIPKFNVLLFLDKNKKEL